MERNNSNTHVVAEDVSSKKSKHSDSSVTEPSCTESEQVSTVIGKTEFSNLKKMVKKLKGDLELEKG